MQVCLSSGLDVLGEISLSSSRQSGFAKAAMECLLDSNLPAKYAMTGALSANNMIQDGFYDCGPVSNLLILNLDLAGRCDIQGQDKFDCQVSCAFFKSRALLLSFRALFPSLNFLVTISCI